MGIVMSYYFGFSWRGFIVFLLPMIPNMFYFLIPASAVSNSLGNSHIILDILEHGSQAIFIFLLLFVVSKQTSKLLCPHTIGMAILLISYYVFWILYFTGNINDITLLGMAILPVAYFILAEIWIRNYLAIIPTVFFGIVHVIITVMNL
jgi:hypothetical protein